jgi:hypothetical protein
MSDLARIIDDLVQTNIEIWHRASNIKTDGRPNRALPTQKRVEIFYKIRELNSNRSSLRWQIDSKFDNGSNETKINYYKD